MPRPANPEIADFELRVKWAVNNLDPNPAYRRFLSETNDVFEALAANTDVYKFLAAKKFGAKSQKRLWLWSLQKNTPSKIFVDWLCLLYPDLKHEHLQTPLTNEFLRMGETIREHRERWRPAIRYYSEKRQTLAAIAMRYYRGIDDSERHRVGALDFPLITARRWIRDTPLELTADVELSTLSEPAPSKGFSPIKLTGLLGDYVAYKGALAYATRRAVRPEPQHNGEIFCAGEINYDANGFFGFKYYLARYFDYINTCEVLGAELASWALSNSQNETMPQLPFRGPPEAAFDLTNRAAYPGINCLAIFLNYSEERLPLGNYFLLHKRDETQLQAQNSVHVVPAGGHQGFAKGGWREDTAIWRTIVREFCEELFDEEDLNKQPETWQDYLLIERVKKINDVFFRSNKPAARVYLHGFGLDPVTLKPEVLVTIVIDWKIALTRWTNPRLKFNWELRQSNAKAGTRHQWARLSKDELLRQAAGGVQSIGDTFLSTLPAGAACMMQTWKHYGEMGLALS